MHPIEYTIITLFALHRSDSNKAYKSNHFLGVVIVNYDVDQVADDFILLIVDQPLDHQMEVHILNVPQHCPQQLLFVEVLQPGEEVDDAREADLKLFVVLGAHRLLYSFGEDHVDSEG